MSDRQICAASIADADEIFRLINEAYAMETGDSGVAFKNGTRFVHPLEDGLRSAYEEGRVLVIRQPVEGADKESDVSPQDSISGVIVWSITAEGRMYFGPFAVAPRYKGQGYGRILLDEVERLSRQKGLTEIEISVVNHRSDLFPMYEKLGYEYCGECPYPKPEILTRPAHFIIMRRKLT